MFEAAIKLWNQYSSRHASSWSGSDPRQYLAGEVTNRLEQLDLILKHLERALKVVAIDPKRARRDFEWMKRAAPLFRAGTIDEREYLSGFSAPAVSDLQAWREVRLFTEMFYFVGFRLCKILNR